MLNFEYKGISQGKYVEGEIEALNNAEAAHKLKEQKVIITKLKEAKKKKVVTKKEKTSFSFGTGIKPQEILIFCKQFATMLRAGLPVLNTLEMLEGQTKRPPMKKVIQTIKKDLESGNALSKCFDKHPKIFDTVVVNLIKAGEASGKLDTFLQKIVINLEKREKIKSQIKSALFYPGVLFSVAMLVTVFMLMNVVPTFVNMYEGMGMGDDLPTPTAVIMSMSEFVRSSGGLFLLIFIILFFVGNGRLAGVSGIVNNALISKQNRTDNFLFIVGLVLGPIFYVFFTKNNIPFLITSSLPIIIIAGFLVGIGTKVGKGCTSGHGICGISLLSLRSIIATITFMITAIITVKLIG